MKFSRDVAFSYKICFINKNARNDNVVQIKRLKFSIQSLNFKQ